MTTNTPTTDDRAGNPRKVQSAAARRFGYFLAILINGAILYVINVWPTWHVVPWLTLATSEVVPWVNASIIVGMVANAVYLLVDRRWLKAIGDVATTSVGLAAMLQLSGTFSLRFRRRGRALGTGHANLHRHRHFRLDRRDRCPVGQLRPGALPD